MEHEGEEGAVLRYFAERHPYARVPFDHSLLEVAEMMADGVHRMAHPNLNPNSNPDLNPSSNHKARYRR